MYIRKWVWQMFYFCTYNNTSTVKSFLPYQRHLENPHFYESVGFIHTTFVHSLECMSIILCNLQRKSLIPSACKLYSDLKWKIYFLIPTSLSVKLKKKIYIYFEGLLFYNEKYLFWESTSPRTGLYWLQIQRWCVGVSKLDEYSLWIRRQIY